MSLLSPVQSADRLADFDFAAHNHEQAAMWTAYRERRPYRVPIILGTNSRYFMFNRGANPDGIEYRAYTEDPDLMFDCRLRFERWSRFNLLQDAELGLPEKWIIWPDFQNYFEAAWFGCLVEYIEGQVPDTRPAFADQPERIMEHGLPDPFGGHYRRIQAYLDRFRERAEREQFLGRPITVNTPGSCTGTDGPFTVACNVFGPEFVCEAVAAEPDRLRTLLTFITEATIERMRAWRKRADMPVPAPYFGFADDSVALISTEMYRQHVLPHHRRLCNALADPATPRSIHLCGDATRHFVTLRDELNIRTFDTGFPVDFARLRRDLGDDVQINGGPHVEFLMNATPQQVRDEVRRILTSGVLAGGRFVLREGNNLAPHTPLANTEALYHAGREFGVITQEPS